MSLSNSSLSVSTGAVLHYQHKEWLSSHVKVSTTSNCCRRKACSSLLFTALQRWQCSRGVSRRRPSLWHSTPSAAAAAHGGIAAALFPAEGDVGAQQHTSVLLSARHKAHGNTALSATTAQPVEMRKRGRPPKHSASHGPSAASQAAPCCAAEPKQRGRPPKSVHAQQDLGVQATDATAVCASKPHHVAASDNVATSHMASDVKRRGRPPKRATAVASASSAGVDTKMPHLAPAAVALLADAEHAPPAEPKRRGRLQQRRTTCSSRMSAGVTSDGQSCMQTGRRQHPSQPSQTLHSMEWEVQEGGGAHVADLAALLGMTGVRTRRRSRTSGADMRRDHLNTVAHSAHAGSSNGPLPTSAYEHHTAEAQPLLAATLATAAASSKPQVPSQASASATVPGNPQQRQHQDPAVGGSQQHQLQASQHLQQQEESFTSRQQQLIRLQPDQQLREQELTDASLQLQQQLQLQADQQQLAVQQEQQHVLDNGNLQQWEARHEHTTPHPGQQQQQQVAPQSAASAAQWPVWEGSEDPSTYGGLADLDPTRDSLWDVSAARLTIVQRLEQALNIPAAPHAAANGVLGSAYPAQASGSYVSDVSIASGQHPDGGSLDHFTVSSTVHGSGYLSNIQLGFSGLQLPSSQQQQQPDPSVVQPADVGVSDSSGGSSSNSSSRFLPPSGGKSPLDCSPLEPTPPEPPAPVHPEVAEASQLMAQRAQKTQQLLEQIQQIESVAAAVLASPDMQALLVVAKLSNAPAVAKWLQADPQVLKNGLDQLSQLQAYLGQLREQRQQLAAKLAASTPHAIASSSSSGIGGVLHNHSSVPDKMTAGTGPPGSAACDAADLVAAVNGGVAAAAASSADIAAASLDLLQSILPDLEAVAKAGQQSDEKQ